MLEMQALALGSDSTGARISEPLARMLLGAGESVEVIHLLEQRTERDSTDLAARGFWPGFYTGSVVQRAVATYQTILRQAPDSPSSMAEHKALARLEAGREVSGIGGSAPVPARARAGQPEQSLLSRLLVHRGGRIRPGARGRPRRPGQAPRGGCCTTRGARRWPARRRRPRERSAGRGPSLYGQAETSFARAVATRSAGAAAKQVQRQKLLRARLAETQKTQVGRSAGGIRS